MADPSSEHLIEGEKPGIRPETAAAWVKEARAGHPEAFAELVRTHQRLVLALARQHTRNGNEAEDLAQETFCRAYRDLSRLRNPLRFTAWLCGITINTVREWRRKTRNDRIGRNPLLSLASERQVEIESPPSSSDRAEQVMALVARLPKRLRVVVTLRYVEGLPYVRVAARLGIGEVAARSRLHRAIRLLRKAMQSERLRGSE